MNKIDLIRKIAEVSKEDVTQKQVDAVLTALEEVVRDVVLANDEVTVPGICKVKPKLVKEKTGTILIGSRKGEPYVKPEHKEGTVKVVTSLKNVFE